MATHPSVVGVTVLVTGAGGLVGSSLMNCSGTVGRTRVELDITDIDAVRAAIVEYSPTAIINAAAQAGVDRSDEAPEETWRVNAEAPEAMAQLAGQTGVRFVHLSTDYVLDAPEHDRLDETVEPNPCSTYARSKLAGEVGVLGAGGVVVRLQWVYQPGVRGFFNRALNMMRRGETVRLVTDQVGCPTPASVLAPALMKIAEAEPSGVFHLATDGEATAYQWIEAAAHAAGVPFKGTPALRADFSGAHRPVRSVLDSSKAEAIFGIRLPLWDTALKTVMTSGDRLGVGAAP